MFVFAVAGSPPLGALLLAVGWFANILFVVGLAFVVAGNTERWVLGMTLAALACALAPLGLLVTQTEVQLWNGGYYDFVLKSPNVGYVAWLAALSVPVVGWGMVRRIDSQKARNSDGLQ
jgi:hypothetical protein